VGRSHPGARPHRREGERLAAHRRPAAPARRGRALIALDTSALTKLVVHEPETPALVAALRGQTLVASALVRTELRRAVQRVAPDRLGAAEALVGRLRLVRLDDELLDAAGRQAPASLRTLDAIHLACALLLGDELDALVTYDARQADAARAAGLVVAAPAPGGG